MLDFQQFVGKQIINSNGQTGVVISMTQERITVKFDTEEIYNPDIAFKRGAIKFVDEALNKLILDDINIKEGVKEAQQQKVEKINKESKQRNKRAIDKYYELLKKQSLLKQMFGGDFIYPPLVKFIKKYPYIIAEAEEDKSWPSKWRRIKFMMCND